jgi:hypothetical protein
MHLFVRLDAAERLRGPCFERFLDEGNGALVPQGRLTFAQDASPGYIKKHDQVPKGRLKILKDCVAAHFQPSLRD